MSLFDWLLGKKQSPKKAYTNNPVFAPLTGEGPVTLLDKPPTLSDTAHMVPTDEQGINRLDFQHFILRQVLRGNYAAPLQKPQTILEVGGGTERWCYEMAQSFPRANVIRCDPVETKSVSQAMPQNYTFVQTDLSQGLPFPDRYFDFVHQRLIFFSIPTAVWPQLLRELLRVTNVGGWVELIEMPNPGSKLGPYTRQCLQWLDEASQRWGVDMTRLNNLDNDLRQAGFTRFKGYTVPVPIGRWGGHLGTMMASNISAVHQVIRPMIVEQLGIDPILFDQNVIAEQQEWEQVRGTMDFYVVCAQRSA